jgi:hypothetical protein
MVMVEVDDPADDAAVFPLLLLLAQAASAVTANTASTTPATVETGFRICLFSLFDERHADAGLS